MSVSTRLLGSNVNRRGRVPNRHLLLRYKGLLLAHSVEIALGEVRSSPTSGLGQSLAAPPLSLDVDLFSDGKRIINLNAEAANGAFDFRMT
jgi:hypothetical protein